MISNRKSALHKKNGIVLADNNKYGGKSSYQKGYEIFPFMGLNLIRIERFQFNAFFLSVNFIRMRTERFSRSSEVFIVNSKKQYNCLS